MTDQTINSGSQRGVVQLGTTVAAGSTDTPPELSGQGAGIDVSSADKPAKEAPQAAKAPSRASPYQARLGYDQDRASVYVEIVESATGEVIQRFPAESAPEEMRALFGDISGAIVDGLV